MTASPLIVHVEGIGWWSPGIGDWASAVLAFREGSLPAATNMRPSATILPPNERRRATEPVLLACDAAGQACAMAQRDAAHLPCVFASAHGDLQVTDALCTTLADEPLQLSPTRFHNSVHNAPTGYWTMAAHCHAASNAVSAHHGSFAAGLLEATALACAEQCAVLFAAYDNKAPGPLAEVVHADAPFAVALVVNPQRTPRALASLHLRHLPYANGETAAPPPWNTLAQTTPVATALPLFVALALSQPAEILLGNGRSTSLSLEVHP